MTSALEDACSASTAETASGEFCYEMECAVTCFQRGGLSRSTLVRMTRSRERQTALFCIARLGNTEIAGAYKTVLYLLLQQPEVFLHFADLLAPESRAPGPDLPDAPGRSGKTICFPPSSGQRAADRCLSALRRDEGFVFPLLFEMLQSGDEELQARTSNLLRKVRLDFVYTAFLLLHSPARMRAEVLDSMLRSQAEGADAYYRLCICDPEPQVRAVAALGLSTSGDPLGMKSLLDMAAHPDCEIRSCAVAVLMRLDNPSLLSMLKSVHWAHDPETREAFLM